MRIKLLGTGHGVPEAERKCSAILVRAKSNSYFFDMGSDVVQDMARLALPLNTVKAVFISHPHGDHTDGLVSFCDIISWYYTDCRPTFFLPNEPSINALKGWMDGYGDGFGKLDVRRARDGELFDDGVIKVTAYPNKHCPDSRSYLVESEGKKLLYTADLKRPGIDFPPVNEADLVICEGAHFSVSEYEPIFKERDFKRAIITHFGTSIGLKNIEAARDLAKAMAPMDVSLARDGMEAEI